MRLRVRVLTGCEEENDGDPPKGDCWQIHLICRKRDDAEPRITRMGIEKWMRYKAFAEAEGAAALTPFMSVNRVLGWGLQYTR